MVQKDITRAHVKVSVTVDLVLDFTDAGYLGVGATVADHLKKANEDLKSCVFLVKQGGLEPKPATLGGLHLKSVSLIPQER